MTFGNIFIPQQVTDATLTRLNECTPTTVAPSTKTVELSDEGSSMLLSTIVPVVVLLVLLLIGAYFNAQ